MSRLRHSHSGDDETQGATSSSPWGSATRAELCGGPPEVRRVRGKSRREALECVEADSTALSRPVWSRALLTYTHKHTVCQTHCKQLSDLCSFHSAAPVADQDERGSDRHSNAPSSCFLLSLGSRLGCVYTSECVHNGGLLPRFDRLPTTVTSGRNSIVTYKTLILCIFLSWFTLKWFIID